MGWTDVMPPLSMPVLSFIVSRLFSLDPSLGFRVLHLPSASPWTLFLSSSFLLLLLLLRHQLSASPSLDLSRDSEAWIILSLFYFFLAFVQYLADGKTDSLFGL